MTLQAFPGFVHFETHHCVTGSLRHIYAANGFNISEEMLFGLGEGTGYIYWQQGRAEDVVAIQEQIIAITQQIGDVAAEAAYHTNVAVVLQSLNRIDEAITHVQTAITLLESKNLLQDAAGDSIDSKRALLAELQSLQ